MTERQTIPGILPSPYVLKELEPELFSAMYRHPEWFDDFIQDGKRTKGDLSEEQIIQWVEEYKKKHGKFPTQSSGHIPGTKENWRKVNNALKHGYRGLPGGSSLAKFINEHFGREEKSDLTQEQIIQWVEEYKKKHGKFKTERSGHIPGTQENWNSINQSLRHGHRGLPGGSSLHKFIQEHFKDKKKGS